MSNQRVTVLINLAGLRRGGGLTHASSFLPELARNLDCDFTIFVAEELREWAAAFGAVETHPYMVGDWRLRFADQVSVRRLAARHDITLSVMNHGPVRLSKPHILWACNVLHFDPTRQPSRKLNDLAARTAMRTADRVVFPSEAANAEGSRWAQGHDVVLRHALRPSMHRWKEPQASAALRVFVPASNNAHKNLAILPETAAQLRDLGYTPIFSVTTSGIAAHPDVVTIPRYAPEELHRVASQHDVAFVPSLRESFSYPLAELEQLGMPIAASDIGAHVEMKSGAFMFPPTNAAAAAQAIQSAVLAEKTREPRMFTTPDEYADRVWDLIREVLGWQS